jgi:N-acetylglucosaminyl-diphospho-decaprenol L-rhamnosyltransferase
MLHFSRRVWARIAVSVVQMKSSKGNVTLTNNGLRLSVIIVSFNTRDLTLAAISSAIGQIGSDCEIIVVDNASTDDSVVRIAENFPLVTLLALPQNIGFGRANNLAAQRAKGQYILLLNPDTLVQPGAIGTMLDFAERRPEARIWGGRTLTADGRLDPRSCARRPNLWSIIAVALGLATLFPRSSLFNPEAMPGWERDHECGVDIVTGCFLMIERDTWQKLGGFDPAYFMYGEEVDLCLRAQELGARPAITPYATITHFEGASQSAAPRMAQILAGRIRYCRKHLPPWQRRLAVWFVRMGFLLRFALYSFSPCDSKGRERVEYVYGLRRHWWNGYPDHS